jgi:hypothetical protein
VTQTFFAILSAILPVFVIAGAGFTLRRAVPLDARTLSALNIYFFIPSLIFSNLSKTELRGELLARYAVASVLMLGLMMIVWGAVARLRGLKEERRAAFNMTMFMNLGNFGLPVALFAFGDEGLALAIVVMVCGTFLQNVFGVYYAQRSRHSASRAFLHVFRYPMIYATLVALIFQRMQWNLPLVFERAIDLTANAAIPVQLMILGLKLAETRLQTGGDVFSAVGLRLLAAPLLAALTVFLCGLEGLPAKAFIVQMSGPVAVSMAVFGVQFRIEPGYLASVVSWSFLLSLLSVSLVLYALTVFPL